MSTLFICNFCGRQDFRSKRGLALHQSTNKKCHAAIKAAFHIPSQMNFPAFHSDKATALKPAKQAEEVGNTTQIQSKSTPEKTGVHSRNVASYPKKRDFDAFQDGQEADLMNMSTSEDSSNIPEGVVEEPEVDSEQEELDNSEPEMGSDPTLRTFFQKYVKHWQSKRPFLTNEIDAIKLLQKLRKSKAALNTYEDIMQWHLECKGSIGEGQPPSQSSEYISRKKLFKMLRERYNYHHGYHQITKITLPFSKSEAKIVWNDAKTCMISLLTDPRIVDEDYLFFGNDPLSAPPDQLNYLQDLNTGDAYLKTYEKLIKKPGKQVLLPVIFYIDGATTGQFADLEVTAVKFSLGIFTRVARQKDYFWRTLGYIPSITKHKSKSKRILADSRHDEGQILETDLQVDEGLPDDADVSKAQDFHTIKTSILC